MTNSIYKHIGSHLAARRKALNITQEDVAKVVRMRRTSIANLENGNQRLPLDTLYKLCAFLELDIREILPPMCEVIDDKRLRLIMDLRRELQSLFDEDIEG